MPRDKRWQLFEVDLKQLQFTAQLVVAVTQEQLRFDLPLHSRDKVRLARDIEWHDNGAAQETPKERCNPLSAVLAPEQNAFAFVDLTGFELPGKLKGGRGQA